MVNFMVLIPLPKSTSLQIETHFKVSFNKGKNRTQTLNNKIKINK